MTRLITDGAESGIVAAGSSNIAISTSNKRSGNCSYGATSTSSTLLYQIANKTELYTRCAVYTNKDSNSVVYIGVDNGSSLFIRLIINITVGEPFITLVINGSVVAQGSYKYGVTSWELIEVYYKIGSSGSVIVKVNGIEDINYSGDTTPATGSAYITMAKFIGYGYSNFYTYYDDIAINDTSGTTDNSWCNDGRIYALLPNGNGSLSELVGSDSNSTDNYLLVDEATPDGDATYVYSETANKTDLYTITDTTIPVGMKITRVWAECVAKDPDAGNIAMVIKSGATTSVGSSQQLSAAYSLIKSAEYFVDPDDSAEWTETSLNAIEAGVKVL